jgi:3-oxoacyl-[acyl-carrier protein] reductase
MTMRMTNKVVLITGASRGLGLGLARRFAKEGAAVALTYNSDAVAAARNVEALVADGAQAMAVGGDVSDPEAVNAIFAAVLARFGRIDIVVANAGRELIDTPITDIDNATFEDVTRTNVFGTFYTLRESARHVTDGGRIIVISSTTTIVPNAGFTAYAGSKAAGRLYVECLAQELGARNITVNGVVPGPLRDAGVIANLPDSDYQALAQLSPFVRLGTVADVEGAVLFLASDDAAWVSGHHLVVNGAAKV